MKIISNFFRITFILIIFLTLFRLNAGTLESSIYGITDGLRTAEGLLIAQNEKTNSQIASDLSPAVVQINVYKNVEAENYSGISRGIYSLQDIPRIDLKIASGSGFFITTDGYILTNKHVVPYFDADYAVDLGEGSETPAEVVYRDQVYDLAIIKIDGANFPKISLADSSRLKLGERIIAIGNALGIYQDSVSTGNVSGLKKNIIVTDERGPERMRGLIQTNAKLYPGDSGGPLINGEGKVVGINVAVKVGRRISYAIPVNVAKDAINKAGILI